MQKKKQYKNGQAVYEQKGDILTYFFKTGVVKAKGKSVKGVMQGKWIFYREGGDLWAIGHFKDNTKHGNWIRYNKKGKLEYDEDFKDGKQVKK